MRILSVATVLAVAAIQLTAAQESVPPRHLYRGPLYQTRGAMVVEPERGLPLEFLRNTYLPSTDAPRLTVTVRSRLLRPIPVSGITLRLAFGPTPHGMVTFRMRAELRDFLQEPFTRILPNQATHSIMFGIAHEDPRPGLLALTPDMRIVFTVERIASEEGAAIFENPDATELLWEALGRPSLSQQ